METFFYSFMGHGRRWLASIYCPSLVAQGQLSVNHIAVALESHVDQTGKDGRFPSLKDISEPDGFF